MDKLKLRYLIREAIENVANVTSKFSVGDKVTTVDGDTAVVTMAEHPFYTVELEETGTTKSFNFKDIAPFQEKEIAKTSEGIKLQEGANASLGLLFHQTHNKPLSECIFRIGSKSYVEFYSEARELFNEGVLKINELDRNLIQKTDIGEYALFENKQVPLDIPFINENYKFIDLIKIKNHLKDKGFNVKVGYPSDLDPRFPVQYENEKDTDGLHAELTKMFGRNDYVLFADTNQRMYEAQFKGKDVSLNKPKRGGSKAYYVYVKNGDKVKKVSFGSGGLRAKINNPKARRAFAARHNCKNKKDRTTAGYWSCNLPRYAKQLGLGANKNTFW
ncbi:hypothetical protein OAE25_00185 [Verrucomicrobiales bacterium]|nr:hypothetical protein [Schleiferiaceae bacterium]MDB4617062.1 hypothetical protein [Verrucomicrobiales bacterium]